MVTFILPKLFYKYNFRYEWTVPKHLKPVTFDQFGHYLAGLIDGDGHFSRKQQLVNWSIGQLVKGPCISFIRCFLSLLHYKNIRFW